MNEIDFSQLEKLQKQMESVDYTKACASAMNVISQRALKYISNVTKPGHYKNGKTGGTLKKSWQAERTTVSGSTVKGGIYTALEYAPMWSSDTVQGSERVRPRSTSLRKTAKSGLRVKSILTP